MKLSIDRCVMCPRMCSADRTKNVGYCGAGKNILVSKIMLHKWEEPPISGYDKIRGSGAIFFTHCPLGCAYCQNGKISRRDSCGREYSPSSLADEMINLERSGAYNINLVSPTQYTAQIIESVSIAKSLGLKIPVVWNTGGYERPEIIGMLGGTVDIFLTDFKYASHEVAMLYSSAADYPDYAAKSLREMHLLVGRCEYEDNEPPMLKRGVIVRHLVLPSYREDSIKVLETISKTVPVGDILLSLMAQYTPDFLPTEAAHDPYKKIRRKVTSFEYAKVCDAAREMGFNGFMQERSSATTRFTPDF